MLFTKYEEDWNVFKNYGKLKFWKLGHNSQPPVSNSRGEVGFTNAFTTITTNALRNEKFISLLKNWKLN